MPNATENGSYEVAIGVHHPERFESYGWFSIDAAGRVSVSSMILDFQPAQTNPSKTALYSFRTLCPSK